MRLLSLVSMVTVGGVVVALASCGMQPTASNGSYLDEDVTAPPLVAGGMSLADQEAQAWSQGFEPRDLCSQGQTSFQNSVHALVRQRCVACHERGPGPAFAVADVAQSYAHILRYVQFDD